MTSDTAAGDVVLDRVIRLGRQLQARGHALALSEIIDATRAAEAMGLQDRELLRVALCSTLAKDPRSVHAFNELFNRMFPPRPPRAHQMAEGASSAASPAHRLADGSELGQLAADLVDAHAGLEGELRTEGHHVQRAYRSADLARLMSEARKIDPALSSDELRARVAELKRLMADDIHAQIGPADDEPIGIDVEDIEFLKASRAELDQIRDTIAPLARRIATNLARRRQSLRSGRVDLRRTARRSLSTGGVPLDVAHRRPRPKRPELFVLCDVSGSVADFSVFILSLVAALAEELPKTRSFVFVDAIDEITDLLESTSHGIEPWQIMRNTNVIGADGHSDYGAVLEQFWLDHGDADLRRRSTVLICGDGRTNFRDTGGDTLDLIQRRARRVYWFNPEPEREWNSYDSAMDTYREACSNVFEVRTLRQLSAAVEQII